MLSARVAQKPTMAVSDGTKKRRNSPVRLRTCPGRSRIGPKPPARPCRPGEESQPGGDQERRRPGFERLDRVAAADHDPHVPEPRTRRRRSTAPPGTCVPGRERGAQHGVDRLAADPGLDAEPAAGDQAAQQRRDVRARGAERGARQDRKGNAVAGAGVGDGDHRQEHDEVAEEDRHRSPATSSCRPRPDPAASM